MKYSLYAFVLVSGLAATLAACGGGGSSSTASPSASAASPSEASQVAGLSLLAGGIGGPGNTDGAGSNARFYASEGMAIDDVGNIYVADSGNNTIRKITPAGVVTTIAGKAGESGWTDGAGTDARFYHPGGIAIDSAGNLYVADTSNGTIRKITPAGVVTTLAGQHRWDLSISKDGTGPDASFALLGGLAIDKANNIYVTDNTTIRKITPAGVVTTYAGKYYEPGLVDGPVATARFKSPSGLTLDPMGNLYVTDVGNANVRKITSDGIVTTFAGTIGDTLISSWGGEVFLLA